MKKLPLGSKDHPDLSLGQAERPAVRLPHPLPLKGRIGRKPEPTLTNYESEEIHAGKPKTKRNPDHPGNSR